MPVYLCSVPSKGVPSTSAFLQRGLTQYTVGQLGSINILGKPTEVQLAYAGYKAAIEAFLYATAMRQKTVTTDSSYPIPIDYLPSIPLPLPSTVFRLAQKPTAEGVKKMEAALGSEGLERVSIGKGDPAFVIKKPSFQSATIRLPRVALPKSVFLEGHSQIVSTQTIARIWQCVSLFLSVNTYSYKKKDFEGDDTRLMSGVGSSMEVRTETALYRQGYDKDAKVTKRSEKGDVSERRKIDEQEQYDLNPDLSCHIPINHAVLVAKPSKVPSSASFGTPSSVPFSPGLLFPFFPGMIKNDTAFVRDIVGRRFFRNLGRPEEEPRNAYISFRNEVGIAMSTSSGISMNHILAGIDLALETQTQVYLLFDREEYLGFALLGEEFQVSVRGQWYLPISATELREELAVVQTHDQSIESLARRLAQCVDFEGEPMMVSASDIDSPSSLADMLAKIKLDGDSNDEEEISEILRRLRFPTTFKTLNVDNITWAVEEMTIRREDLFDSTIPIFIPLKGWSGIDKKEYHVLASFGSRSFSFIEPRGVEVRVPKDGEADPFEEKTDAGKAKYDKLIIYEKGIRGCLNDWSLFVEAGCIKADWSERAVGSRAVVLRDEGKKRVWDVLKKVATAGHIRVKGKGSSIGSSSGTSSVLGKRPAMSVESLENVF